MVVINFESEKAISVETEASNNISSAVLSQHEDTRVLHPVTFYSKRTLSCGMQLRMYDKELLVIIRYFEEREAHVESTGHQIQVHSDHRNLEYYVTSNIRKVYGLRLMQDAQGASDGNQVSGCET